MTLEEASIIEQFSSIGKEEQDDTQLFFDQMTDYLVKLAGSEQEYMRIFSWIVDSGVLTKLKNYSDLLSERAEKNDADYIQLHNSAHKSWLDCLHAVDLIRDIERGKGEINHLSLAVKKALNSIKKLMPVIKKIIPKYDDDENVLYFILRYSQSFDRYLGKGWTRKLFNQLHPQGILPFFKERFDSRGFDHLIPHISQRLEELST